VHLLTIFGLNTSNTYSKEFPTVHRHSSEY